MTEVVNSSSVIKFEELLSDKITENIPQEQSKETSTSDKIYIPKGRPKSGKFWKETRERASSLVKSRGLRQSWEKKEKLRQDLKRVKEKRKQLKQEFLDKKEEKKQRRRDNLKRQEENRKRSEIVQVIKNTSKIKRMKKKQLRNIEKRDTLECKK